MSLLTILPDFAAPEDRATIVALMPLAGIGVALGVGVPLLRLMPAVRVVQIGFLAGIIIAGLMWLSPGSVILAVSFAGALGLVQGGSFAVIPQLVPGLEGRALTQGAMAQMGNLGNLLGTPILIGAVSLAGHTGLILFVWAALGGGLAVHSFLAARRARP